MHKRWGIIYFADRTHRFLGILMIKKIIHPISYEICILLIGVSYFKHYSINDIKPEKYLVLMLAVLK